MRRLTTVSHVSFLANFFNISLRSARLSYKLYPYNDPFVTWILTRDLEIGFGPGFECEDEGERIIFANYN